MADDPRPAATQKGAADTLNSLLRGELSAVESYDLALGKFDDYPAAAQELRRVRDEHQQTVQLLRGHVAGQGGEPSDGSGPWGSFVAVVTGAASAFGPGTALAALKRGEEHGIGNYQTALDDADLSAESKELIRTQLLPRCEGHLAALESVRAFVA